MQTRSLRCFEACRRHTLPGWYGHRLQSNPMQLSRISIASAHWLCVKIFICTAAAPISITLKSREQQLPQLENPEHDPRGRHWLLHCPTLAPRICAVCSCSSIDHLAEWRRPRSVLRGGWNYGTIYSEHSVYLCSSIQTTVLTRQ
jgi:hypothetical protein